MVCSLLKTGKEFTRYNCAFVSGVILFHQARDSHNEGITPPPVYGLIGLVDVVVVGVEW